MIKEKISSKLSAMNVLITAQAYGPNFQHMTRITDPRNARSIPGFRTGITLNEGIVRSLPRFTRNPHLARQ